MPLTLLGNNSVAVGDGWVLYNLINLQNNRTYTMELQITSATPAQIYSKFVVAFSYPSQFTGIVVNNQRFEFYYEAQRQSFDFFISPNFAASGNARFAVQRFPFYSQPGTLADADVALAVDPAIFY